MKVVSREYKAMLDHGRFGDRAEAVKAFWAEVEEAASRVEGVKCKGEFDRKVSRTIVFLDTPDLTIARHGLVLRRREEGDGVEYTLKCRSDDLYFAAGTDVRAAEGLDSEEKLEEDIAAPFLCRYLHSATVTGEGGAPLGTLGEAAALFPVLGTLRGAARAELSVSRGAGGDDHGDRPRAEQ